MAEKTAPQYNSHISCSAGKIRFTVIFSRDRDGGEGVGGAEGGGGERRGGEFYYIAIS